MLFDSTFLSLFHVAFCPKYIMSEAVFMSEEGHFLPLEEGVKYLPNPYILHFFFVKCNILIAFCFFSFRYYEGKDYLYSWNIDVGLLSFM